MNKLLLNFHLGNNFSDWYTGIIFKAESGAQGIRDERLMMSDKREFDKVKIMFMGHCFNSNGGRCRRLF